MKNSDYGELVVYVGYTATERIFQFFQISVDEGDGASPTITLRYDNDNENTGSGTGSGSGSEGDF